MSWRPWIDHDGSGMPKIDRGTLCELALADPIDNFDHYNTIRWVCGEKYSDPCVYIEDPYDGSSWTLPVVRQDILYVYRYRLWRPPSLRRMFGVSERRVQNA